MLSFFPPFCFNIFTGCHLGLVPVHENNFFSWERDAAMSSRLMKYQSIFSGGFTRTEKTSVKYSRLKREITAKNREITAKLARKFLCEANIINNFKDIYSKKIFSRLYPLQAGKKREIAGRNKPL